MSAGLPPLPDGLYVKRSRLRRKAASKLLRAAGMVRPARKFKMTPTLSRDGWYRLYPSRELDIRE